MEFVRAHKRYTALFIVVVLLITTYIVLYYEERGGKMRITFFDVGQGDSVLIESPTGGQLLYDAGPPSGAVLRGLGKELPFYDRTIDVAVLSHPDLDHIGGFPDVFRRYHVGLALEPGVFSGNGAYETVLAAITDRHVAHEEAHLGHRIELGGGVVAEIIYPDRNVLGLDTNAASITMIISYGTTKVLLSGDLPQEEEEHLVRTYGTGLDVDIFKLGHHGSRTSTSPLWLTASSPKIGVISRGKENRYGHPHQEVIDLLNEQQVTILDTGELGSISFESDGREIRRVP